MSGSRMPREESYRLIQNLTYLKDNFDPMHHLVHLQKWNLIDHDGDWEELERTPRVDMRVRLLINKLIDTGGEDGYERFLEFLKSQNLDFIVDKLSETVVSQELIYPWAWYDEMDEEIKQHQIKDIDASRISRCLGRGWEQLFLHLGTRQTDIDVEKYNKRLDHIAICTLLVNWWHRESKKATVNALVDNMKELDRDIAIDMEKFKSYINNVKEWKKK